jgi:proteasome lid subunit RPN8/RPN11
LSSTVTLGIELYRTDDYVRAGRIELASLLVPVFEAALGEPLRDVQFRLNFHPIPDAAELGGSPRVTNLRRSHGYVTVQIVRDGRVFYRHPHSVREIIGRPLQQILAGRVPEEQYWGFGISGPGLEGIALERPAPRPVGSVNVTGEHRRPRVLSVERLPEPDPPPGRLADLGVQAAVDDDRAENSGDPAERTGDPAENTTVRVVMTAPVHDLLQEQMELSDEVEEGGFLVGRLLRDQDGGGYLVHVTGAPRAERTGASLLHFTFTGESFLRINQAIADSDHDERLVGWYHTHLFPATKGIGLSTIDVDLHSSTFLDSWHLAALINIDDYGHRVLRFYTWDGTAMRQAPCLIGQPWPP